MQHISKVSAAPMLFSANVSPSDDDDVAPWDGLMSALKIRLSLTAGEVSALPDAPSEVAAARIQASVLECVDVLETMQIQLFQELDTNQRLMHEIHKMKIALRLAKDELAGTQAGERRARHRASHDSLTLLGNRVFFGKHLEKALSSTAVAEHVAAVLYIDLDGFKLVNDTHGHAVGDQLLRIVAARLNQAIRVEDLVCRLGGDEFACVLGGPATRLQLEQLAGKLFDAIACDCKINGLDINVRPSIGIALCPSDGQTPDELLQSADAAMYHAKRMQTRHCFADAVAPRNQTQAQGCPNSAENSIAAARAL